MKGALPLLYHDTLTHREIQSLMQLVIGLEKPFAPVVIVGANSIQTIQITSALASSMVQVVDDCHWNNLGLPRSYYVSLLRTLLYGEINQGKVNLILNDTEGFIDLYDEQMPSMAVISKKSMSIRLGVIVNSTEGNRHSILMFYKLA